MPSTITAFHKLTATSYALADEVNENFSNIRGNRIPINEDTATASDLTHYLGASGSSYANVYTRNWDIPTSGGEVHKDGVPAFGWQVDPVTDDGTDPGLGGFSFRQTSASWAPSTGSIDAIPGMTCTQTMGYGMYEIHLGVTFDMVGTTTVGCRIWPYLNSSQATNNSRIFEYIPSVTESITAAFHFDLCWLYKSTSEITAAVWDFRAQATGSGMNLKNMHAFVRRLK